MQLLKSYKELEVKHNLPLRDLTSFRIGGSALYFFIPHTYSALRKVVISCGGKNIYVLGGGSNILVKDGLLTTPVIKLGYDFKKIERFDRLVLKVGAGVYLNRLLCFCVKEGLSGLEEFAGIPATVGGMAKMNASSFGREFFSLVEEVELLGFDGKIKIFKKNDISYGYRNTSLEGIITKLVLRFQEENKVEVDKKIGYFLSKRLRFQDFSFPSAGCVFKNPSLKMPASYLIEQCGLKGKNIGDAYISCKHANFILNKGKAKSTDVKLLIEMVREKVKERFGINLEEEIIRWEN